MNTNLVYVRASTEGVNMSSRGVHRRVLDLLTASWVYTDAYTYYVNTCITNKVPHVTEKSFIGQMHRFDTEYVNASIESE